MLAAWVFFYGLGSLPLTDWDEAWHAQVASEIVSRGDWLWLHYRNLPYFNKPPLTFWLKAVAFHIGGVNESSARFFPALFGGASVMMTAWFFAKLFDRLTGLLAGFILCTSWLFTLHHAGRSGETDSTLIFFQIMTFISLWQARRNTRWYYLAGVFTALGWMTKGSTAYLLWPVMLLGRLLEHLENRRRYVGPALADGIAPAERDHLNGEVPSAKADPAKSNFIHKVWFRHAAGGLALALGLTLPWQGLMLARYGRVFAKAFYVGEGALPAMQVIENHPGDSTFYLQIFHAFFQPWFLLAAATVVWALWRKRSAIKPAVFYLIAWGGLLLVACSLFATKMVWYATPALPPLAGLAAAAGIGLSRRRGGWMVLLAVAGFGVYQVTEQSWTTVSRSIAGLLVLLAGWRLATPVLWSRLACEARLSDSRIKRASQASRFNHEGGSVADWKLFRWQIGISMFCLAVPLAAHFRVIYGVIVHGKSVAEWSELNVDDEPWRELCRRIDRDFPGRPIVLAGIPLNPAAYFYLHQLRVPSDINSVALERVHELQISDLDPLVITRIEWADTLHAIHFQDQFSEGSLLILRREGIGPVNQRPMMRNYLWGGKETNRVGTHAVTVDSTPPALDIAASRGEGRIFLHVANMNYSRSTEAKFAVKGMVVTGVKVVEIAPESPRQAVQDRQLDAFATKEHVLPEAKVFQWRFPARSVSAVELDCRPGPENGTGPILGQKRG